jgi:transposase
MSIITVGIDLAKNVFAVHRVDDIGKPALVKPKVSRADLLPLIIKRVRYRLESQDCGLQN